MKKLVLSLLSVGALSVAAFEVLPHGLGNRKLILAGWEFRHITLEEFLDHADEFDKTPADGVVIYLQKNPKTGRDFDNSTIMTKPVWKKEQLADIPPLLRKMTKHRSLRHSFLKSLQSPTGRVRLDWRDDKAWAVVATNMAVIATVAREGGLPGLQMDVEDYSRRRQFWRISTDPPLEEMRRLARQRGREVFKAVFDAYPDITMLAFWGLSELFFLVGDVAPASLELTKRDLYPSFLNGMLDVMPPTARFIDGDENSYRFDYAKRDFLVARTQLYNWYLPLIAPENRLKYLSQYKIGFALYMDMYSNPKSSWYFPPIDGSRLEYLRRNAAQALSATDEYVWLWCEKGRWIDWKPEMTERLTKACLEGKWSDRIPGGLHESLLALKDPERNLLPNIEAAIASGAVTNIVEDSCISDTVGGEPGFKPDVMPSQFRVRREHRKKDKPTGQIGIDTSCGDGDSTSVFIKEVGGRAYMHFERKGLQPRSGIYVKARVKGEGAWPILMFIKDGAWMRPRNFLKVEGDDAGEWRTVRSLLRLPDGAEGFTLMLGAGPLRKGEIVRYDNIGIYLIPERIVNGTSKE